MVAPAKLLTRDARKVERKKSGQLKARKKFTVRICLGTARARVLRLNRLIYVVILWLLCYALRGRRSDASGVGCTVG